MRALTEQREIELEAEATDPDGNVDNDYSKLDVLVRDGPVGGAKINLSQLA